MKLKLYFLSFLLFLSFFSNTYANNTYVDSLITLAKNSYKNSSDSCALFANKALIISKELKYQEGEMHALYQLSKLTFDQGDLAKTLEQAQKSLTIANTLDSYEGKTNILNVIAKVYYRSNEFKKALTFARRSYKLALNQNDSTLIPSFLELISTLKRSLGDTDSAFIFTRRAIKINRIKGHLQSLSYSYNNLGILHYNSNNIDSSLICFQKTLIIRQELKEYKSLIQSHNNIGYILMKKGEYKNAIKSFNIAINLGRKHKVITYLNLSYDNLTEAYEKIGEDNKALATYRKYTAIKDSISGEKAKIDLLKVEQKTKLKDEKNKGEQLIKEIESAKLYERNQLILIIILIITLILSILTLRTSKRRALEAQFEKQKTNAAKAITEEYEKMDNWIANELHDDIGGSIAAIRLNMLHTLEEITNAYEERIRLGKSTFEIPISKLEQLVHSRTLEISNLEAVNQNIRKLSHALGPVTFQGQSFISLIENKISEMFPRDYKITIHCLPEDELNEIEENLKFNIYRILQNLSANIVKHANSTQANIQVIGHKDHMNIIVEDNGIGFDKEKEKTGIGLHQIKQRLLLFNGKIEIDSKEGNGTTIIINIPYEKA